MGLMPEQDVKQHPLLDFIYKDWWKILLVAGFAYYLYDLKTETQKNAAALQETLVQQKLLKDGSIVLQGNLEKQSQLDEIARQRLTQNMLAEIKASDGRISSIYSAIGELKSSIENVTKVIGVKQTNGSFTASIDQDRGKDKPPLTSLSISYDASKPSLTEALKGSQWHNNLIVPELTFGEFRKKNDGVGVVASLMLKIYKDDNKTILVGEERVPLVNAEAFYTFDKVLNLPTPPKYNFVAATIHDAGTGRNGFIGILDTKVTRSIGIATGVTVIGGNKNYILGTSISFGHQ